jgi:hypothetical protein
MFIGRRRHSRSHIAPIKLRHCCDLFPYLSSVARSTLFDVHHRAPSPSDCHARGNRGWYRQEAVGYSFAVTSRSTVRRLIPTHHAAEISPEHTTRDWRQATAIHGLEGRPDAGTSGVNLDALLNLRRHIC